MDDYQKKMISLVKSIKDINALENESHHQYNFCNICNKEVNFSQWLYRKSQCPVCGSLERHRAMAIHIWSYLPELYHKNVLHFAPERCLKQIFLSIPVNYIPTNYSPKDKYNIDITNISYPDNHFELIIVNQILEHIKDDKLAISELYRVLKRGGRALLTVPMLWQYQACLLRRTDGSFMQHLFGLDPDVTYEIPDRKLTKEECFEAFGQTDHLRIYGLKSLTQLLESVGFKVNIARPSMYPKEFRQRLDLIDDIIICTK